MRRRLAALLALALCLAPALQAATARERAQKLMKTMLKDRDPRERADAARQLGTMGATDAVPALAQALSDDDRSVRASAALSLWKLGEVSRPAMPELRKAFDRGPGWARLNAGGALEKLGMDRRELLDGYRELLSGNDPSVRVEAASRLRGLVPDKELRPVLTAAFDDDETRRDAQEVLRELEPEKGDTEELLARLHHRDSYVRRDTASQLARMKPVPREAVPEIIALLEDGEETVRRGVCSALGTMGAPYAAQSVPKLIVVLRKDEDPEIRAAAESALGEIGPAAKAAIPALVEALQKDEEAKVREAACEGLQGMGKIAKEAIPALQAAQKDADGFVRGAAWRALLRVDPR